MLEVFLTGVSLAVAVVPVGGLPVWAWVLIVLFVVGPIGLVGLSIVAAIAIPSLMVARLEANEAKILSDLQAITVAIETYAEDYMTKPFDPAELSARVGRILKRIGDFSYTHQPLIEVDEHLAVDFVHQKVIINERPLALTPTETKLLYILMRNAGKTVLTEFVLRRVWPEGDADENTLRVHIHRLRQKIEVAPSRPRYVVTERGMGYSFLAPAAG